MPTRLSGGLTALRRRARFRIPSATLASGRVLTVAVATLALMAAVTSCGSGAVRTTRPLAAGSSSASASPSQSSASDRPAPGDTWTRLNLPGPSGGSNGYQWSTIACSSDDACLVGGAVASPDGNQQSVLEATANGGQSWKREPALPSSMDGGVESAACDHWLCLVVAYNRAVTAQTLGATSDGGNHWSAISTPPSWSERSVTAALLACSATRCLVYGNNVLTAQIPLRTGFAETSDDGHTWIEITIPGSVQIDRITCLWSGRCWALYDTATDEFQHVATTTDGGSTWSDLGEVVPSETGNNTFVLDPDHQVGFACQDTRTCFILDNSNDLLRSGDGGHTWAPSPPPRRADGSADLATDAMTCTPTGSCWIISGEFRSAWTGPVAP